MTGGGGGPVDVRLSRDVLPYNPTVVTIMLGMNDGRYRAFDQATFDEFATGFKHITDTLKRQIPGVRITAIQPSPYDDVTHGPGPSRTGSHSAGFRKHQRDRHSRQLRDRFARVLRAAG